MRDSCAAPRYQTIRHTVSHVIVGGPALHGVAGIATGRCETERLSETAIAPLTTAPSDRLLAGSCWFGRNSRTLKHLGMPIRRGIAKPVAVRRPLKN